MLARLLRNFAGEQQDALSRFDQILKTQPAVDAADMLHALRGAAANLGATTLAQAAGKLEQEVRAGEMPQTRADFSHALKAALAAIAKTFPESLTESGALHETDLHALADLFKELIPYLQNSELIPKELGQALEKFALRDLPKSPFAKLIQKIDRFDHEGALLDIEKLIDKLKLKIDT